MVIEDNAPPTPPKKITTNIVLTISGYLEHVLGESTRELAYESRSASLATKECVDTGQLKNSQVASHEISSCLKELEHFIHD